MVLVVLVPLIRQVYDPGMKQGVILGNTGKKLNLILLDPAS